MRDILKKIFIGIVIGMSLFFLKTHVFAASGSFWGYDLRFDGSLAGRIGDNTVNLTGVQSSGTTVNLQRLSGSDFSPNYSSTVYGFSTNYAFVPYTLYSITYYICSNDPLTGSTISEYFGSGGSLADFGASVRTHFLYNSVVSAALNSSPDSNHTFNYCRAFTHSFVFDDYSSTYWSGINIRYTSAAVRTYYIYGVEIQSQGLSSLYYDTSAYTNIILSAVSSGVQGPIEDQTDEILDSDSPASATYNNDYSTSSYDTAESNINSSMDVDVSGVQFDSSRWSAPFSYIWSLVTSFLGISSKVFAMITGFLTLSFVGLVIGRS